MTIHKILPTFSLVTTLTLKEGFGKRNVFINISDASPFLDQMDKDCPLPPSPDKDYFGKMWVLYDLPLAGQRRLTQTWKSSCSL